MKLVKQKISENVYVDLDLDREGNLINMTIEHAKKNACPSQKFIRVDFIDISNGAC